MNMAERNIRQPAVAGQFYPQQPTELRAMIDECFSSPFGPGPVTTAEGPHRLLGVVAPHAGYAYSGPGAAWAFAEVARDGRPATVVILGVNHRGIGAPLAVSPASGWATPLGVAPVDTALAERLCTLAPALTPDAAAHRQEHSLEVQVPFLQYLFGEVPILPIAIGDAGLAALQQLGQALGRLAHEQPLLIVASTDFSHYVPRQTAYSQDSLALERIVQVDAPGLLEVVRAHRITMCGVLPVFILLTAARDFPATAALLHYHTSGDIVGDPREVVGYGAAAVYRNGDK